MSCKLPQLRDVVLRNLLHKYQRLDNNTNNKQWYYITLHLTESERMSVTKILQLPPKTLKHCLTPTLRVKVQYIHVYKVNMLVTGRYHIRNELVIHK